jgi:hypothetical protein
LRIPFSTPGGNALSVRSSFRYPQPQRDTPSPRGITLRAREPAIAATAGPDKPAAA